MFKILVALAVVLGLTSAALATFIVVDGGGSASANSPIDCSVDISDPDSDPNTPPVGTVTCTGEVEAGPSTINFELVVEFVDNPPSGPSFGDEIISCSLNGVPVDVGPCPPNE